MNTIRIAVSLTLATVLFACGGESTSWNSDAATEAVGPTERLAEMNRDYIENAILAKRTWGGKRLVLGGAFESAWKNSEGTFSILLNPGPGVGLGELQFNTRHANFIAMLRKGDRVTAECTVLSEYEEISPATLVNCSPGSVTVS